MGPDVRRSPRIPFVASAEIICLDTETRLPARTGDLSQHGCYIDMVHPLPLGTNLRVQIVHEQRTFAALAGVVYSHPPLGMGLAFSQIESGQEAILETWLSQPATE